MTAKRKRGSLACTTFGGQHHQVRIRRHNAAGGSYGVELVEGGQRLTLAPYDLHDVHELPRAERLVIAVRRVVEAALPQALPAEIRAALAGELARNYAAVVIDVVDAPDMGPAKYFSVMGPTLSEVLGAPWSLAAVHAQELLEHRLQHHDQYGWTCMLSGWSQIAGAQIAVRMAQAAQAWAERDGGR